MEWKDKFHDILKETERNLENAKGKLRSRIASPRKKNYLSSLKSENNSLESPRIKLSTLPDINSTGDYFTSSSDNMNNSTSLHMLQMQDQISSQNRMIEKLQRLVKSLDSEREYYKEQITVLKRDIDMLTDAMKGQTSISNSDLKMSNVKNEVMQEINKVKAMVHNKEMDSAKRSSVLSPRYDTEFWNIKENLTDNLEEVRFELNQMKRRIDHMEDRLASPNTSSLKQDSLHKRLFETDQLLKRPLYTPTQGAIPHPAGSDLQLLKLSISSLTEKLDNLERKSYLQLPSFQTRTFPSKDYIFQSSGQKSVFESPRGPKYYPYISSADPFVDDDNYDAQSLSDLSQLSDLSNLSGDNIDDLDFDLMTLNLKDDDTCIELPYSSRLKNGSLRRTKNKSRVEFDLNDLDLSDLNEEEDANFDLDNFEL